MTVPAGVPVQGCGDCGAIDVRDLREQSLVNVASDCRSDPQTKAVILTALGVVLTALGGSSINVIYAKSLRP